MIHKPLITIILFFFCFSTICFGETTKSDSDKTVDKINEYLNQAFNREEKVSSAIKIQYALNLATAEREKEGNSRDPILRDAEYFLHGLYATSSGDIIHTVQTSGVTMYVALKYAAYAAKDMGVDWFEELLRTDSNKPTSEPGGIFWAYSGLCDGMKIDGTIEIGKQDTHGLNLFTCGINELLDISAPAPPEDFRKLENNN